MLNGSPEVTVGMKYARKIKLKSPEQYGISKMVNFKFQYNCTFLQNKGQKFRSKNLYFSRKLIKRGVRESPTRSLTKMIVLDFITISAV